MIREHLFGQDPKITKSVNFAKNVAVTKAPILVIGEFGTGKRALGQFIHENSTRAAGPLLVVDCAAEAQTVEDEVLGKRDPMTGEFRRGVLERGNGGTIIFANLDGLDEKFQKRLHQIFSELSDYEIDVRIIATTTKNLSKLVGSGRFYRGLYTLISGTQIFLTPLRERVNDIEYLAKAFMSEHCEGREEDIPSFSVDAKKKILTHYWTHNVEELKSIIDRSMSACSENPGRIIEIDDLAIGERKTMTSLREEDDEGLELMSLKDAERLLIRKALIHTSENRTQAAKILGVSIRTLRNKINEYRNGGRSYFVNLR